MISIIIPTLNEEKYLPKLLQSIKNQTYMDYEVIVADAGSTDNTKKIAKSFGTKVVKGGMPAKGRNCGAKVARGEFLFFFDSDVKFSKTFLKSAYDEIQNRFLDIATCEFRPLSNFHLDRVMHDFANASIKIAQFTEPHAPGFCILVTKRLFERINGFDESIRLAEDHDFVRRAAKFRQFRVLRNAKISVSVRRLKKEGRFVLLGKYLQAEKHRIFKGEIRDDSIKYEFANFKPSDKKRYEKQLRALESRINRFNHQYKILKNELNITDLQKSFQLINNTFKQLGMNLPGKKKK